MRFVTLALTFFALFTVGIGLGLLLWSTPEGYKPVVWEPGPLEASQAAFGPVTPFSEVRFERTSVIGPEAITISPDGHLYTGAATGEVFKIPVLEGGSLGILEEIARITPRPLEVEPAKAGGTLMISSEIGLLVQEGDTLSTRASTFQGAPLTFTNSLAETTDGTVYFTTSTSGFAFEDYIWAVMSGAREGSLFSYTPGSGTVQRLATGLGFANGLALSADERFLVVAETTRFRLNRFWLTGPKAGRLEPWIENLPGFPDNVTRDADGTFWVALASVRTPLLDFAIANPWARILFAKMPEAYRPVPDITRVMAFTPEGQVVANLEGRETGFGPATSAFHHQGKLYLGSLTNRGIGVIDLP